MDTTLQDHSESCSPWHTSEPPAISQGSASGQGCSHWLPLGRTGWLGEGLGTCHEDGDSAPFPTAWLHPAFLSCLGLVSV